MTAWNRIGGLALTLVAFSAPAADPPARVVPLKRAHAHNDYEHPRPLLDALDRGFCSVEADIYLTPDGLLVGHDRKDLKPGRTLEALYLDPLRARVKANGGSVYPGGPPFWLLIDVKSGAEDTYAALDKALATYADLLSATRDGKFERKAVTIVVSGNRAKDTLAKQKVCFAGLDARPEDLGSDAPADLIPWVSANWTLQFRWRGDGPMPDAERAKLKEFVAKAHKQGRLVRFWATPEAEAVWAELLAAGVDLVNTDKLDELQTFLLARDPAPKKP